MRPLRILSLGAGVQSTTLALMVAHGEIEPIDYAIFSDTQSEPQGVYGHLARLMTPGVLPFPIRIVSKGSLRQEILDASAGKRGAWGRPPLFLKTVHPVGSIKRVVTWDDNDNEVVLHKVREHEEIEFGMTRRQCTGDYKVDVIMREIRQLAGIKRGSRGPKHIAVQQLIGISLDEAHRMKDPRFRWVEHLYPLVDLRITRKDCEAKLAAWGWSAPKSACTFCPYHSDAMWLDMKRNDPAAFADAVTIDSALRSGSGLTLKGEAYLHSSREPLETVDFEGIMARRNAPKPVSPQLDLFGEFGNECEGMCGV